MRTRFVPGMSVPEKIPLSGLSRGDLEALTERLLVENAELSGRWRTCVRSLPAQRRDGAPGDPAERHGAEDGAEEHGGQARRQAAQDGAIGHSRGARHQGRRAGRVTLQGLRGLRRPGSGVAPACRAHPPGALADARRADSSRADAGRGCRPLWAGTAPLRAAAIPSGPGHHAAPGEPTPGHRHRDLQAPGRPFAERGHQPLRR